MSEDSPFGDEEGLGGFGGYGALGALTPDQMATPDYLNKYIRRGSELVDKSVGALDQLEQGMVLNSQQKGAIIQKGLDALLAQKPDHTATLLAMASGFLKPTRTGRFGESLGEAGGAAVPPLLKEQERTDARKLKELEYRLAQSGAEGDIYKTRYGAATERAKIGRGLMSDALKADQQRLMMLSRQSGSKELAEIRARLAKTPAQREAEQLFPDDPEKQAAYVAQSRGIIGAGGGSGGAAGADLTGEDFLNTLDPAIANQVRNIAEGFQPVKGMGKQRQQIMQLVNQYDPTYNEANYPAMAAMWKEVTSGQTGKNISAFNTAPRHMLDLDEAFDRLKNSSMPSYNYAANELASKTGDPALKRFDSAKTAVATELAKAYRGAGALSQEEIRDWMEKLSPHNSPAQHKANMQILAKLLRGRIEAIGEQTEKVLGPAASKKVMLLSPKNVPVFDYFEDRGTGKNTKRPDIHGGVIDVPESALD